MTPSTTTERKAFTLVELLVVVSIIILLAGILMPSLQAARNAAKEAACSALIHTLATGLDMYKAESRLRREYPPSFWPLEYGNPYTTGNNPGIFAYGAQTLVWAVAGADVLGTPGFPRLPIAVGDPLLNRDTGSYYEVVANSPSRQRFGPYVDISKTRFVYPNQLRLGYNLNIEDDDYNGYNNAPVITDSFGFPVLFYAANAAGTNLFDSPPGSAYYDYNHNSPFTVPPNPGYHPINNAAARDTTKTPLRSGFQDYIEDNRVLQLSSGTATAAQNRESFLLISAGVDKKYGTSDDLTNFNPNAQ